MKDQVEQFLHKFADGIKLRQPPPNYRGKPPINYFEKGFYRKYGIKKIHYEFFVAESGSVDSYKKACQKAIE
jgi:hypothetical protein